MSDKLYRARSGFVAFAPMTQKQWKARWPNGMPDGVTEEPILIHYVMIANTADEMLFKVLVNAAQCIARSEHPDDEEAFSKRFKELSDRYRID